MGEHGTSIPPEANTGSPGHHPSGDERAEAALRQLVRLLARIAVVEAFGISDAGEQSATDLPG
jgi:hypothetical protein